MCPLRSRPLGPGAAAGPGLLVSGTWPGSGPKVTGIYQCYKYLSSMR